MRTYVSGTLQYRSYAIFRFLLLIDAAKVCEANEIRKTRDHFHFEYKKNDNESFSLTLSRRWMHAVQLRLDGKARRRDAYLKYIICVNAGNHACNQNL